MLEYIKLCKYIYSKSFLHIQHTILHYIPKTFFNKIWFVRNHGYMHSSIWKTWLWNSLFLQLLHVTWRGTFLSRALFLTSCFKYSLGTIVHNAFITSFALENITSISFSVFPSISRISSISCNLLKLTCNWRQSHWIFWQACMACMNMPLTTPQFCVQVEPCIHNIYDSYMQASVSIFSIHRKHYLHIALLLAEASLTGCCSS